MKEGGQLAAFVPMACLETNPERLKSLIKDPKEEDSILFPLLPLPGGRMQVLTSVRWRLFIPPGCVYQKGLNDISGLIRENPVLFHICSLSAWPVKASVLASFSSQR